MGKNVVEVEQKLLKVVPAEFKVDVHHWLILHGRYTCVARKPKCGSCIIEDLCEFKDKVSIEHDDCGYVDVPNTWRNTDEGYTKIAYLLIKSKSENRKENHNIGLETS